MNYCIGVLHLFCNSPIDNGGRNYDESPYKSLDEMHTDILIRWNRKITNGDTVHIPGNISMCGRNEHLIALVAQMKRKKVLVKGNHDYKELSDSFDRKSYKVVMSRGV